jgi:hypothetical protein
MLKNLFRKRNRPAPEDTITIVSGLPRSGTSMMMRMLEAGGLPSLTDAQRGADEDNPAGYYEFERVKVLKEGDSAWLAEAQGKAVKIIAALLPHLPGSYSYRVLLLRRAMPEILASQRQMLKRRGENPDAIGDAELAELFQKHLSQVDTWMGAQPNIRSLDVDYNRLLADAGPQIVRINAFLGGGLDEGAMAAVVDPSLYRQRK